MDEIDRSAEDQLQQAMTNLAHNESFQIFKEHIINFSWDAHIKALSHEKFIKCTNAHFIQTGKIEAYDEIKDLIERYSQ